ncbi:MAG TPA: hypothetical protein VM030_00330 [Acidimicrobiales bacterium]|nr:hypothetical protein [Acidimicrobiales bacterium]
MQAEGQPRPLRDHRLLRDWAVVAGVMVVMTTGAALWANAVFTGVDAWWVSSDFWLPVPLAHYVVEGAGPFMYDARSTYLALPGMPLVLAPAVALTRALGLTESYPMQIRHPSAYLVLGPYTTLLSTVAVLEARRLATALGVVRRRLALQVAVTAVPLVAVVTFWGHVEDALALAGLLAALRLTAAGEHRRAAIAIGLAVLFKQWALMGLPIVVFQAPVERRIRTLLEALALPAAFAVICLAAAFAPTVDALLLSPSFPNKGGHRQLWIGSGVRRVPAAPLRALPIVIAALLGWRARAVAAPLLLVSAVAVAAATRLLVEPVVHSYYLAPAAALAIVVSFARHRRGLAPLITALLAALAHIMFAVHPSPVVWWSVFVAVLALMLRDPLVELGRGLSRATAPPVPSPR